MHIYKSKSYMFCNMLNDLIHNEIAVDSSFLNNALY